MKHYEAPFYTEEQLDELEESQVHFPYSNKDATYVGKAHQYELTNAYFLERDVNLEKILDGSDPEKVQHFLANLRRKVYNYIYTHNKSTRNQLNYLIASRALRGYGKEEYREAFLEAMFIEGQYLAHNGDISDVAGIDLDTMQNMSADVMRNQDRDMHKDCIRSLQTLGLMFYGQYSFVPKGSDW